MRSKKFVALALALSMIAAAGALLTWVHAHQKLSAPAVKTMPVAGSHNLEVLLPEQVLDYTSEKVPIDDVVLNFLRAHVETTQWIAANLEDAKKMVNAGLQDLTGKALGQSTIDNAWKLISLTNDPVASAVSAGADNAYALGFLSSKPDLSKLFALDLLNKALKEKNLAEVKAE